MTARTHDAFAFASLLTIATIFPPSSLNLTTLFASIVANIIGSLIPDMDQATNRLWDFLPAGDHLGKIFRKVFIKHRTLSHSFLGLLIISQILGILLPIILNPQYVDTQIIWASMMIGYVSHLVADSFTKEGLPLFFPLKFGVGFPPLRFLRITTGSWVENWLILPGIGAYVFWFIGKYQNQVTYLLKLTQS